MGFPSTDLLEVIYFLLPGFVAAWIFYGFTAHPRQSPFERVVEALIFTALVQALTAIITSVLYGIGETMEDPFRLGRTGVFAISVAAAAPVGIVAAALSNNNLPHGRLWNGITKRTSLPSEWYAGFSKFPRFIYLHLKDGRTLYGWPQEWPDAADAGHFLMTRCEWILNDGTRVELPLIEAMLLPAERVETVEFERPQSEITPDLREENAESLEEIRDAREKELLATSQGGGDDVAVKSSQQEHLHGKEASIPAASDTDPAGGPTDDARSESPAPPARDNCGEEAGVPAAPAEDLSEPVTPRGSDD